jgi:hypothetical protein
VIDKYGAKASGMLQVVYEGSPYLALMDLALHDKEFTPYISYIEQIRHQKIMEERL